MVIHKQLVIVMLMVFLCDFSIVWAETNYISDQLVVSLREQPQKSAKQLTFLKTDTQVEVLEVGEVYSKVKTTSGEVGYIKRNYLSKNLPKTISIKKLALENERLKDHIETLKKSYDATFSQGDEARLKTFTDLEKSREQLVKLQKDLHESNKKLAEVKKAHQTLRDNAQNIVATTNELNQLRLSHEELTGKIDKLEDDKDKLLQEQTVQWFLSGAGVLFLGWLIGKLSKSRRRSSF